MKTLIERALQSRKKVFQVAIVAALIALGVNMISGWLSIYFKDIPSLQWLVGMLFILIGFLYFVNVLLQERQLSREIEGLILLDPKSKSTIDISDYQFSRKLSQSLNAAFIENEALRDTWEKEMHFDQKDSQPEEIKEEIKEKT